MQFESQFDAFHLQLYIYLLIFFTKWRWENDIDDGQKKCVEKQGIAFEMKKYQVKT